MALKPPQLSKRQLFDALNRSMQTTSDCWIVSPFGPQVRLEALPDSVVPEALAEQGFKLRNIGTGERIITNAIEHQIKDNKGRIILKTTQPGFVATDLYILYL